MSSKKTQIKPEMKVKENEGEASFRALAEISASAVFVFQGNRIKYANPAAEYLTGYSSLELLEKNFHDLFPVARRKFIRAWGMKVQRNEISLPHEEFTIISKNANEILIDFTATFILFEGKPAALGSANVLNRKPFEDALRESEDRFRHREEELSALYETTREISTQQDIKTLLKAIVDRAALLLNAPGVSVHLKDGERNELELIVAHDFQGFVGTKILPGKGLVGKVMQTMSPAVMDDYRERPEQSTKFDSINTTTVMAAPMIYSGELVGVLSVNDLWKDDEKPIRKFTNYEMEQLTFFARAAASAVHNARLFEETRQRLVELELLYQASLSAAQIHSPKAVAQRIVDTLEQLLNWKGSIWLDEEQRLVLLAISTKGLTGRVFKHVFNRLTDLITNEEQGIIGWVCKNGRTIRDGRVKENPRYIPENDEILSELCVPLKIGGKTIGCINVESPIMDAYSEHDERVLTTLANQAAIAIENARLFEETRRRASRQLALNTIIHASARTGIGLDEILNIALDQTLKALGFDMGAIWLSGSPRGIQRVAARGIPSTINSLMTSAASSKSVALSRTIVVNDWSSVTHPFADLFLSMGVHSTIMVPLLSDDKRIGNMAICSTNQHLWTTEETVLVDAIGREVGLAAERARLFEVISDRLKEMEAVNKISSSFRQAQSLKEMLPQLVDETLMALDTDTGGIWLFDQKRNKLQQAIGRGWCVEAAKLELERGESFLGNVLTNEDVYFSSDVGNDDNAAPGLRELSPAGWSAVCVPIRTDQDVIGVFMVSTPLPREFSGEDARLLVTLTEITGSAIHRMRLNERLVEHASELEERVTERTEEMRIALQKAQAADRVRSEFIANINHELRTPLTNLVLYYQMLRAQPTVKMDERLDVIGRELQRLRNLIEDLLNLSRLDLGHVTFHLTLCDLNLLVKTLVTDRQALAVERGLSLRTELDPNLAVVDADEPTILQVISNLLTNAMNYTPAGGEVLIRTMRSDVNGKTMVGFSVEDTGPGISPEDLPHLFERFFRGGAGRQSGTPGTGLGLAIVQQIVDHHKGKIEVKNLSDGKGSIFTIWLPVNQSQEAK